MMIAAIAVNSAKNSDTYSGACLDDACFASFSFETETENDPTATPMVFEGQHLPIHLIGMHPSKMATRVQKKLGSVAAAACGAASSEQAKKRWGTGGQGVLLKPEQVSTRLLMMDKDCEAGIRYVLSMHSLHRYRVGINIASVFVVKPTRQ